jgi:hypothetical protein
MQMFLKQNIITFLKKVLTSVTICLYRPVFGHSFPGGNSDIQVDVLPQTVIVMTAIHLCSFLPLTLR